MLKTIVKRAGFEETFYPEKLNKWSRWAVGDLGERVDWSDVVFEALHDAPEKLHSQDLQERLINACVEKESWPYQLMAGRLFTAVIRKKIFPTGYLPSVKKQHQKMQRLGLMVDLGYSEEDYEKIDKIIDHSLDFKMAYFQIKYLVYKYSLQDRLKKIEYETPQFVYMRMAMAVLKNEPPETRIDQVREMYAHLAHNRINAPTPNYNNLGTPHHGLASCCLYAAGDTARSLAIGDHIAYTQTYMSAGIGGNILSRSMGDSIRNGMIEHQGKLPYYAAVGKAVKANKQGSRGGAATIYYSVFDPEVEIITMLQNPKTTENLKNRDIHFAILTNKFFAGKVARNEDYFTFNIHTAPDLHKAFYSHDSEKFKELYQKYEDDDHFKKNYKSARQVAVKFSQQFYDVATLYHGAIDEMNRHTPFLDPIYSSNLCAEITEPTQPYESIKDLYLEEDHGRGEVALCTIAGIVECNIENDAQYASAAYYALKMIDECIDISDYELPHVGFTAKHRRNAAVGLVGTAVTYAKHQIRYDSKDGLDLAHKIAERHAYFVIEAALRLGQERGNAPWIHKTKWPQGWLPLDTYNKKVDQLTQVALVYPWDELRQRIIAQGGLRFSTVIAHMPTESSSKASGVPNGIYPVRELALKKTDGSNAIEWVAVNNDLLEYYYQSAWSIREIDLIKYYSVFQKFTDQSISADLYRDRTQVIEISDRELIEIYLAMMTYGFKTKYYTNSLTSDSDRGMTQAAVCGSGGCTL